MLQNKVKMIREEN